MEKPLLGDDENKITDAATHKTIQDLQQIALERGVPAMIATAFGMSYAIAHMFKTLGLRVVYKSLQADLTSFIRRPSSG